MAIFTTIATAVLASTFLAGSATVISLLAPALGRASGTYEASETAPK